MPISSSEAHILERTSSLGVMVAFYFLAGLNHFVMPAFYIPLIPDHMPFPGAINAVAGLLETVLAIGLIFLRTRRIASYLIILMLVAFIPSHVFFIQEGSCLGLLCVPPWVGWARLLLVHPFLIVWAYRVGRIRSPFLTRS